MNDNEEVLPFDALPVPVYTILVPHLIFLGRSRALELQLPITSGSHVGRGYGNGQ